MKKINQLLLYVLPLLLLGVLQALFFTPKIEASHGGSHADCYITAGGRSRTPGPSTLQVGDMGTYEFFYTAKNPSGNPVSAPYSDITVYKENYMRRDTITGAEVSGNGTSWSESTTKYVEFRPSAAGTYKIGCRVSNGHDLECSGDGLAGGTACESTNGVYTVVVTAAGVTPISPPPINNFSVRDVCTSGGNTAIVSWDGGDPSANHVVRVDRIDPGQGAFSTTGWTPRSNGDQVIDSSGNSANIGSLERGKNYAAKVDDSNVATFTCGSSTPPVKPSVSPVTCTSSTAATINWSFSPNTTDNIELRLATYDSATNDFKGGGGWFDGEPGEQRLTGGTALPSHTGSYAATGLTPGQEYAVKIRGVNDAGGGDESDIMRFTCGTLTTPPIALSCGVGNNNLSVQLGGATYADPGSDVTYAVRVDRINRKRGQTGGFSEGGSWFHPDDNNDRVLDDDGDMAAEGLTYSQITGGWQSPPILKGGEYAVKIQAVRGSSGPESSVATITCGQPTLRHIRVSETIAGLNTPGGHTVYEPGDVPGGFLSFDASTNKVTLKHSFSSPAPGKRTLYFLFVSNIGTAEPVNPGDARPYEITLQAPAPPRVDTANTKCENDRLTIAWVKDGGAASYEVRGAKNADRTILNIWGGVRDGDDVAETVSCNTDADCKVVKDNVIPGSNYFAWVQARNEIGLSDRTEIQIPTCPLPEKVAASGMTASCDGAKMRLEWDKVGSYGEYRISGTRGNVSAVNLFTTGGKTALDNWWNGIRGVKITDTVTCGGTRCTYEKDIDNPVASPTIYMQAWIHSVGTRGVLSDPSFFAASSNGEINCQPPRPTISSTPAAACVRDAAYNSTINLNVTSASGAKKFTVRGARGEDNIPTDWSTRNHDAKKDLTSTPDVDANCSGPTCTGNFSIPARPGSKYAMWVSSKNEGIPPGEASPPQVVTCEPLPIPQITSATCDGRNMTVNWTKVDGINKYRIAGTRGNQHAWEIDNSRVGTDGKTDLERWWEGVVSKKIEDIDVDSDRSKCTGNNCSLTTVIDNPPSSPTVYMQVWIHSVKEMGPGDSEYSPHGFLRQEVNCEPIPPTSVRVEPVGATQPTKAKVTWAHGSGASPATTKYFIRGAKDADGIPTDWSTRAHTQDILINDLVCAGATCESTIDVVPGRKYFFWMSSKNAGPDTVSSPAAPAGAVTFPPLAEPVISNAECGPSGRRATINFSPVAGGASYQVRFDSKKGTWCPDRTSTSCAYDSKDKNPLLSAAEVGTAKTLDVETLVGENNELKVTAIPAGMTVAETGPSSTGIKEFTCNEVKGPAPANANASCDGVTLTLTWDPVRDVEDYTIRGTRSVTDNVKPWEMTKAQVDAWWGNGTTTGVPHNLVTTTPVKCNARADGKCVFTWPVPNPPGSPTGRMNVWVHAVGYDREYPINSEATFVKNHISCFPNTPQGVTASCDATGKVTVSWNKTEGAESYSIRGAKGLDSVNFAEWGTTGKRGPERGTDKDIVEDGITCTGSTCSKEVQMVPGRKYFTWVTAKNKGPLGSDPGLAAANPVTCAPLAEPVVSDAVCGPSGRRATISFSSVTGAANYQVRYDNDKTTTGSWFKPDQGDQNPLVPAASVSPSRSFELKTTVGKASEFKVRAIPTGVTEVEYGDYSSGLKEFTCNEVKGPAPANANASCDGATLTLTWDQVNGVEDYLIRGTRGVSDNVKPWEMTKAQVDAWWGNGTTTGVPHNLQPPSPVKCNAGADGKCVFTWPVPNPPGSPTGRMNAWVHAVQYDGEYPINSEATFVKNHISCFPNTPQNVTASCDATGKVTVSWNKTEGAESYSIRGAKGLDSVNFAEWGTTGKRGPERGADKDLIEDSITCTGATCSKEIQGVPGRKYFTWVSAKNKGPLGSDPGLAAPNPVQCAPLPKPEASRMEFSCNKAGTQATLKWASVSGAASYQHRINKTPPEWTPTVAASGDLNPTSPSSETQKVVTVTPDAPYLWTLQALPAGLTSQQYGETNSNEDKTFTCAVTKPAPPTITSATCTSGTLNVVWTGGGPKYEVRVAKDLTEAQTKDPTVWNRNHVTAGDLLFSDHTTTSISQSVGANNQKYTIWVHSDDDNILSDAAYFPTQVTCAAAVTVVKVRIADNPANLEDSGDATKRIERAWSGSTLRVPYTFSSDNRTPGTKTIYVKFYPSAGAPETKSAAITLSPTTSPSPCPTGQVRNEAGVCVSPPPPSTCVPGDSNDNVKDPDKCVGFNDFAVWKAEYLKLNPGTSTDWSNTCNIFGANADPGIDIQDQNIWRKEYLTGSNKCP